MQIKAFFVFLLVSTQLAYTMEKPIGKPIFAPAPIITPEQEAEIAKLPEQERKYKLRDFIVHNVLQESKTFGEAIARIKQLAQEPAHKDALAFDIDYIKKYGPIEWLAQQQKTELNAILKFYLYAYDLLKKFGKPKYGDLVMGLRKAIPNLNKLENKIVYLSQEQTIVGMAAALKEFSIDPDFAPFLNNYQFFEHAIYILAGQRYRKDLQIKIVAALRTPIAAEYIRNNIKWSDLLFFDIVAGNPQTLLFLVQNLPKIEDQDAHRQAARIMLIAIHDKDIELAKLLLSKGFDPNTEFPFTNITFPEMEVSYYYTTPLMEAVFRNSPEIVTLLLESGADPNVQAKTIESAKNVEIGQLPLIKAIRSGQTDIVRLLLFNPFAQQIQQLRTAQQQKSYLGIIPPELAIQAAEYTKPTLKADPNLPDGSGRRALNEAAAGGNLEIIRMLLDAGAQINEKDANGNTPLIAAVMFGKLESIKLLIEKGADPNLPDNRGNSALDYAQLLGKFSDKQAILDYLQKILKKQEEK